MMVFLSDVSSSSLLEEEVFFNAECFVRMTVGGEVHRGIEVEGLIKKRRSVHAKRKTVAKKQNRQKNVFWNIRLVKYFKLIFSPFG